MVGRVQETLRYYPLDTLHAYRCEGCMFVVIEAVYISLFEDGDDGGDLQTVGNGGISQAEVERPGEDP